MVMILLIPDFLALGGVGTLPDGTPTTEIKYDFGDTQVSTRIRSHERPAVWLNETPADQEFPNGHFLAYKDEVDTVSAALVPWVEGEPPVEPDENTIYWVAEE